jgi:hypothetical protein
MSTFHTFAEGTDENSLFYGQTDSCGAVANAAEEIHAVARKLHSPASAIAAVGMARLMLIAEVKATLPAVLVERLLAQDAVILAEFAVIAVPHPVGDA